MNLKLQKILVWPICLIFLIGIVLAGNYNVLCIDDKGYGKFETFCIPCCDETEKNCESVHAKESHDESDACSNCSDIEIDGQFWVKRIQTTGSDQFYKFVSEQTIETYICLVPAKDND